MKKIVVCFILLSAFLVSFAQEDLSVNNFWTYNGHTPQALYLHINTQAVSQLNERWAYVGGLKTKEDWLNRQAEVKTILTEIVGKFPAKTPLNPVITGTLKREGFTVEKLYFESRPGFFVTASLFLPSGKKGKLPAIVYCSGHSNNGFRSDAYQHMIINLARKGFVVLAFDPIGQGERIQYFDGNGVSVFGPTVEHSYPGAQSFISGLPLANYFIWDGIRVVDYLLTRKEVDPARMGITGRSGGGTQSAYIAAMDERILCAAPECYITSFDKLLRTQGPQDAEQNLLYALKKGFDLSDFIEVRAPKPTLIITTTRDMFSIQGARDVYSEAKNAFVALGDPHHLQMVEDDAGHASTLKNREATYVFFQQFLNNPGNPKDEEVELFDEKDLWVTPTGQVLKSLKSETLFSLNEKYTVEALKHDQSEKQANVGFYSDLPQKIKLLTGYREPVITKDYIFSGRLWRDNCSIEKYLIKGVGHYYIPLLCLSSNTNTGKLADGRGEPNDIPLTPFKGGKYSPNTGKVVLLIDDQGKASAAAKGGLAERLALKGYKVIVPDLSGFGESGEGLPEGETNKQMVSLKNWFAGILTQYSPLAVRLEELKIIVDFINGSGMTGTLTGIACGTSSSDLLHAAVIHRTFNQIALINPLMSFRSIVQEKDYLQKFVRSTPAGVIPNYDLPDLVTALAPLKISLMNPVNALDQPVDRHVFDQTYADARKKYGDSPNLAVYFNENDPYVIIESIIE